MDPKRHDELVRKLRLALEMSDAGCELMRQNLRRRHPDASEAELSELYTRWLHHRPGAEHGDAWGRSVPPSERFG